MRELLHLILREASLLPTLDPRPGLDVRNAVLALAVASEVLAFFAGVLSRELDFEHAVSAQGFLLEALDGVGNFLGGGAGEVVYLAWILCEWLWFIWVVEDYLGVLGYWSYVGMRKSETTHLAMLEGPNAHSVHRVWISLLTLVRSHRSVGEEEPLQALVALQFILEAEGVFLVGELEQVE